MDILPHQHHTMPPATHTPTCAALRESLAAITAEHTELTSLLAAARRSGNYTAARAKKRDLAEKIAALQEQVNPFERILGFRAQYEAQVNALRAAGLLVTLTDGSEGIRSAPDKDNPTGIEYPLLTQRDVVERMRENRELFLKKAQEGLTELLIVPFALPLEKMKGALGARLTYWEENGGIYPEGREARDKPLTLDADPVRMSSEYTELRDGPTSLTDKTKWGKTKADLLKENSKNAWRILLTRPDPIPRAGKGTGANKTDYEAGKTPIDYLTLLAKNNEVGLTPEAWLAFAMKRLETDQTVLDDWQGRGSASYLLGACIPTTGSHAAGAPYGYWFCVGGLARLGWYDAADANPGYGCRSGVGV